MFSDWLEPLKAAVSLISSNPPFKHDFARFTRVPLKALSGQVQNRYPCFYLLKLFIFICCFSAKSVLLTNFFFRCLVYIRHPVLYFWFSLLFRTVSSLGEAVVVSSAYPLGIKPYLKKCQ